MKSSKLFPWFALINCVLLTYTVAAQQLIWIGTLGGVRSEIRDVSADGRYVVGRSQADDGKYYPFRWDMESKTFENPGSFGGRVSIALGISADGRFVVGYSQDSSDKLHAFLWDAETGVLHNISPRPEYETVANGISADGRYIVGNFTYTTPNQYNRAFIIDRLTDTVYYLGTLGGAFSGASNISPNGQFVVGTSEASDGLSHAFVWIAETNEMLDLGMEGEHSEAQAVSNNGLVVGHLPFKYRSFVWSSQTGTRFELEQYTNAFNVSADGRYLLGNATSPSRFAALWDLAEDTIYNLNQRYADLLTPSSELLWAASISADNRYIVGWGRNGETGQIEGFILDTQEPTGVGEQMLFNFVSVSPNPLRHNTHIRFSLQRSAKVTIHIIDIFGNLVYTFPAKHLPGGMHTFAWDGVDDRLRPLPNGIYVCVVAANEHRSWRLLHILR